MTITTTITEQKQIQKEVELPHLSKINNEFVRINEDQTILKVFIGNTYSSITLSHPDVAGYATDLQNALSNAPCTEDEFLDAIESVRAKMEASTLSHQVKERI